MLRGGLQLFCFLRELPSQILGVIPAGFHEYFFSGEAIYVPQESFAFFGADSRKQWRHLLLKLRIRLQPQMESLVERRLKNILRSTALFIVGCWHMACDTAYQGVSVFLK